MRKILSTLLQMTLLPLAVLSLFRLFYLLFFVPINTLCNYKLSWLMIAWNSLRFDMQTIAYLIVIPFLLLLLLFIGKKQMLLLRICRIYFTVCMVLLTLLCVVDIGFYLNFNSHINITFFDFFNEGPLGLIVSFWQDYPVVWLFFGIVIVGVITWRLTGRLYSLKDLLWHGYKTEIPLFFLSVLFFFIAMRGSVVEFPLQVEDTVVTDNTRVNDIIPNATYMLKKAYKDKSKSFKIFSKEELLSTYGFRTLDDVFSILNVPSVSGDTVSGIKRILFNEVPDTLTRKQPNVVIIVAESWSNYLFTLDNSNSVLSQGLRKHFSDDLLFTNFQSVCNGTIATIERLTVMSPVPRLFMSKYRYKKLPTSITIPFNKSGYDCSFITGMDIAWENINVALAHQGFTDIVGKYKLLSYNPSYDNNTIGVYDHYLFDYLINRINVKKPHPQMTMVLTTTNHPPFTLPDNVNLPKVGNSFYENNCFNLLGKDVLEKYIRTFQYFNKCLSDFLDEFKKSPAAENTILIVTGDHNVRSILNYNNVSSKWKYSVPLYIYMPPYLRSGKYPMKSERYGSHYDILPTIAPFAFKNVEYVNMGYNLLDDSVDVTQTYSYNEELVLSMPSNNNYAKRIADAKNVLLRLYFQSVMSEMNNK